MTKRRQHGPTFQQITKTLQWTYYGVPIPGETGETYAPRPGQNWDGINCVVTYAIGRPGIAPAAAKPKRTPQEG